MIPEDQDTHDEDNSLVSIFLFIRKITWLIVAVFLIFCFRLAQADGGNTTAAPTVSITSSQTGYTNDNSFTVSFTFSEAVTGFDIADITVGNGTASNFVTQSGDIYTADITPVAEGTVTVDIAAGIAQNGAMEDNLAGNQFSIVYDTTPPNATISTVSANTNTQAFTATITLTEELLNPLAAVNFSILNGTFGGLQDEGGNVYTLSVIATNQGTVTIGLFGILADLAGNFLNGGFVPTVSVIYDASLPTVTISSTGLTSGTNTPFTVTAQFSENIDPATFTDSDITLTNATISNLVSTNADTYTFLVTPITDGTVTAEIAANTFADNSGNINSTASNQLTAIYDATGPIASITSSESDPTNNSPVPISIDFGEDVIGFDQSDLILTNGTINSFSIPNPSSFIRESTMGAETQAENLAVDDSGNIYVSDEGGDIRVYDASGNLIRTIDDANGESIVAFGMLFSGNILYAANDETSYIDVFNDQGVWLQEVDINNGSISDMTLDGSGNLYVTDMNEGQIEIIQLGGGGTVQFSGSGTNAFTRPRRLTLDHQGNLLIVDENRSDILVFTTAGDFVRSITGSGAQTLIDPQDVEVDDSGNVYVSDRGLNAVLVFDSSDNFLYSITGSGTNTLDNPNGLTLDNNGNIFVANNSGTGNDGVFVFSLLRTGYGLTVTPTADGIVTLDLPANSTTDAIGNSNNTTQFTITFDQAIPTVSLTTASPNPLTTSTFDITAQFSEAVTGFEELDLIFSNASISNFNMVDADTYSFTVSPLGDGMVTVNIPANSAADGAGNSNTASNTLSITADRAVPIPRLNSVSGTQTSQSATTVWTYFGETVTGFDMNDVLSANATLSNFTETTTEFPYSNAIGVAGTSNGELSSPMGMAVDASGNIYVVDQGNNRIQIFDATGAFISTFGSEGSANGQFNNPDAVAIDASGNIYVADMNNHRVQVFDGNHQHIANIGTGIASSANDAFNRPSGVAIDEAGNLFVSDFNNHRVQVFDASRNYIATIGTGSQTTSNSGFIRPLDVHIDTAGNIYVTDIGNHRVQVFTSNLVYSRTIGGSNGSGNNQFNDLEAVTTDGNGRTYVVDRRNNRIQIFDNSGNYLSTIGTTGSSTDLFEFPLGIALSPDGSEIYVSDANQIKVFENAGTAKQIFRYTLTALAEGEITSSIATDAAVDGSGNGNLISNQLSVNYDITGPVATINAPVGYSSTAPFTVTVSFDEPVFNFASTSLRVIRNTSIPVGQALTNFTQLDATTYAIDVTPDGSNTDIRFELRTTGVEDFLGNRPTSSVQSVIAYDASGPILSILNAPSGINSLAPFNLTFEFDEDVLGFTSDDIALTNAVLSDFITTDGNTYTTDITPTGTGDVVISLPAGTVTDVLSNPNQESSITTVSFDITPVDLNISTSQNPTASTTFDVSLAFDETVVGFDQTDITVSNGLLNLLSAPTDNHPYSVTMGTSGTPGMGNNEFNQPSGVAIGPAGEVYISDMLNHRVQIFDSQLSYMATIGITSVAGSANNQLSSPRGVHVGSDGTIYIADTGNNRVQIFDQNRNYTATLSGTVSTGQSINSPRDIATDAFGNVYVVSRSNDRFHVFDSGLNYIATLGSFGNDPGEFNFPEGIAIDHSGNIYVADANNERFQIFDHNRNHLATIGMASSPGSGNNQFDQNVGIALSSDGRVYVADGGNERVQVYDNMNNYLTTIGTTGTTGTGNNQFSTPQAIAVSESRVFVADLLNHRVQVFDLPAETYTANITATTAGTVNITVPVNSFTDNVGNANTIVSSLDVVVDNIAPDVSLISNAGSVVNGAFLLTIQFTEEVTDFTESDLIIINATPSTFTTLDASTYTVILTPTTPGAVTVDLASAIAQDALGNDNTSAIQFNRTFNPNTINTTLSTTEASPSNSSSFDIALAFDTRTTALNQTNVIVSNGVASNFVVPTPQYAYANTLTLTAITTPEGIAVAADGTTYVSGNNRVEVYDASGNLTATIGDGSVGNANTQFNTPRGLALDASGNLYVADRSNHRIQVFNSNLAYMTTYGGQGSGIGGRGSGDNDFRFPTGVAIASNGNIYVADQQNERVQVYDSNFNYIATIGTTSTPGSSNSALSRPSDVAIETATGRIFIADQNNDRVQVFESDLSFVTTIGTGSAGSGNDAFNNPNGIFVDAFGDIYIADQSNHRVQVFDSSFNHITTLGTGSSGSGSDAFTTPAFVGLNPLGTMIYVTDQSNNRLQVFDITIDDYTATVTPTTEGAVMVSVADNQVTDGLGNPNASSNLLTVVHDLTSPTIDIQGEPVVINNAPFTITIQLSEVVTGFDLGDISVVNGTADIFTVVDGDTYTVQITPDGNGDILIDVFALAFTDLAGNPNIAAPQATVIHDIIPPGVSISSSVTSPSNAGSFTATFTFTESVSDFTIGNITASNANIINLTGSGDTYMATLVPLADGPLTLDVSAGIAIDAAGNGNTAAPQLSIDFDYTAPTVTISSTEISPSNASAIPVTITFNEAVTGFDINDLTVDNGTAGNFTGTGAVYTVEITPVANGAITLDIAANTATDLAGNSSAAATQFSITSDLTHPTVSFTTPTVVSNITSFDVTLDYSETVTGVTPNAFAITNGTLNAVTGTAVSYTLNILADGQGDVIINTLAVPVDAAGNTTIPAQTIVTLDITFPDVSITSIAASRTNLDPIPVIIQFTEPVTGFDISDLIPGNASLLNFSGTANQYLVDISPTMEGTVTLNIASGVAMDQAGNGNTTAPQFSRIYDDTNPQVTITSPESSPSNSATFSINIDFNENVTGLSSTDFTVVNASLSNLTGSGMNYTADLIPSADGPVTVQLPALSAQDEAGLSNDASNQFGIISDQTAPVTTISTSEASPTNATAFTVDIMFSENVTGFDINDIVVTGGTLNTFSGTGNTYSVVVSPNIANGDVTINVAANSAEDDAGNGNVVAPQLAITMDTSGPDISLTAPLAPTIINASFTGSIFIVVAFSETTDGFDQNDFVLTNATVSDFFVTNPTSRELYMIEIIPDFGGDVTLDIAAEVATDMLGNPNTAASQLRIPLDITLPTVILSGTQTAPLSGNIVVDITFNEDVTGLSSQDLVVSNGTTISLTGSGRTYTAIVEPITDGLVTVDLPASAAEDAAGNGNTIATQFSITSDNTLPTVVVSSTLSSPTNSTTIPVTFTFSENVTGFDQTDIRVTGATVGNFISVSSSVYTAVITAMEDGTVIVDVGSGAAIDQANNGNTISNAFAISSDQTAPVISLSNVASPNNNMNIPVTASFTEDVSGFDITDLLVSNGTATNFVAVSSAIYTFAVIPTADGTITVDVASASAVDNAGNGSTVATQLSFVSDQTVPTVILSTSEVSPTNAATIPVTITFSENVTGFDITDLITDNGTPVNFVPVSANVYTVDITPTADGLVTIDIAAGTASDAAGNTNTTASQLGITSERSSPSVVISTVESGPTNSSVIPVTITFSEDVMGFDLSDLTISNGTSGNFMAISASSYSVDITPVMDGAITVDIAAAIATDPAGNGNTASDQLNIVYDSTAPSVIINSAVSDPTNDNPIPVTISFNEEVTDFLLTDISVNNGTATNLAAISGSIYSVNIMPDADGAVTINIAGSVATDLAGNGNMAASQYSVVSDRTSPEVVILNAPTTVGSTPFSLSFNFNEVVADFIESDISVANGSVSNFSGSGTSYNAEIMPTGTGDIIIDISSSIANDLAGNGNTAAAQVIVLRDLTAPVITITSSESSPSNASTISTSFTFSESVLGFELADIMVDNGIVSNLTGSGSEFTADISPLADGTVTIDIPIGSVTDMVGNVNAMAAQLSIISDRSAPTVTAITRLDANPITGSSVNYRVAFSEAVIDIESSDFELASTGTVMANIASVSANSGMEVTVTIDGITGEGTLGLNITNLTDIRDEAMNNLGAPFVGETYSTNASPTDIMLSRADIDENNAPDALIGSLTSLDPNAGDLHTYSIVPGPGDADNAAFSIDGNGLRTTVAFDFETQNSYSLRIQTDDGNGGRFEKPFTITINDVAEPQIELTGGPLTFSTQTDPIPVGLTAQLTFDIVNNGDGDLIVNTISLPDPVFTGNFTGTVAANSTETVTISFAPTAAQTYSGNITVSSNAGDEQISVSGVGAFVTGIDIDLIDDTDISLFPNPANQYLKIDLRKVKGLEPDIGIYNSRGLILFNREKVTDSQLTIDVGSYSQGIYLVTIKSGKGTIQKKVIIKR